MPLHTSPGIGYVMLGVTDMARSLRFYEQTLGRKVLFKAEDSLAFIDGGPVTIGLNKGLAARRPEVAGAVELVFKVDSVKGTWRALTAKGVTFFQEPRPATDKDWVANFTDPDGHVLTLFGPPGE